MARDPKVAFVGFASSRLWRTRNNGITSEPGLHRQDHGRAIDQARAGQFRRVLFLHTGGAPALYAYRSTVLGDP